MSEEKVKTKLDIILEEWKEDCKLSETNLSGSSMETPKLHCKYLSHLVEVKHKLSQIQFELSKMKKLKLRYYKGELSKEELELNGWDQYQLNKPLKSEQDDLLNGDEDMIKIKIKEEHLESMKYTLESILGQLKSRDFQIKNSIEWLKYTSGGY